MYLFRSALPGPPFGVEVTDPTSSAVTILWNEPTTGQGAVTILGYNVYKRLQSNRNTLTKGLYEAHFMIMIISFILLAYSTQ